MSFSSLVASACLCTGVYLLITAIRNLYFHPLSSFPGPRVAAATILYKIYYDVILHGKMLDNLKRLHKVYGPVVRIGPNELHFSETEAYFDIYLSTFIKEPYFYRGFGVDQSSFGFVDIQEARTRREMLNPLFSRQAILRLEPIVQEKVDKLVSRLSAYKDAPVNISHAVRCATMDIITSYCFAHSFDTLDAPQFRDRIILGFGNITEYLQLFKYFPIILHMMLSLPDWIAQRVDPFYEEFRNIRNQAQKQIDGFLNNPDSLEDTPHEIIYHHLIKPKSNKAKHVTPSRQSLQDESITLIQAGSETVGNACEFGTFMVLYDKEVLKRLTTELTAAWPDPQSPMSYTALEKLPYLTAVIKESLRMAPGVLAPLPRVVGLEGAIIAGKSVPSGAIVSTGVTFMHNDDNIFPDPEHFNPERWLQPDIKVQESHLVPFSRGARMCLGINLAWCELYILFANIFRKFDLEIHDTSIEHFLDVRETFITAYKPNSSFQAFARPSFD